jgi:hypothetical protein
VEAENRRRRGTLLVEDGCNTCLTGDVWRALGREPGDLAGYACGDVGSGVLAWIR